MRVLVSLDGAEYLTFESLLRMGEKGIVTDYKTVEERWIVTFVGGWTQTYVVEIWD